MQHGNKAVVGLSVDPSGARLATGSIDYEVSFWDFAGKQTLLYVLSKKHMRYLWVVCMYVLCICLFHVTI